MTIPIVPGPFSFLEGAGEAAGEIGAVREERKRYAQQIAEHGSNFVLSQILNGADPSMLDDPNVQKMMKTAYGFAFPSSVARAIGAPQREAGAEAQERINLGVPKKTAEAAGAQADVATRTATAQMAAGLPELDAQSQAAVARAQREGANLNVNIFQGANALLGSDPKFARLAYEAATGALDARIHQLELNRQYMSLDRQQAADNARILLDAMNRAATAYDNAMKSWEADRRNAIFAAGKKPDDPETWRAFAETDPPPDRAKFVDDFVRNNFGFGADEFQRRLSGAMSTAMGGEVGTTPYTGAAPGAGAGGVPGVTPIPGAQPGMPGAQPVTPSPLPLGGTRVQIILNNAKGMEPQDVADNLYQAVQDGDVSDLEAAAIIQNLRVNQPGKWFKKFNQNWTAANLGSGRTQPGDMNR